MRLLHRSREGSGRPPPDEAPLEDAQLEPEPERAEPKVPDPGVRELSRSDYVAILRRALKQAGADHVTNLAAALAYYAFLAIPSALMVGLGVFGLLAGPGAVSTVVDKLGTVIPGQAQSLVRGSLSRLAGDNTSGVALLSVGGALTLWSLTGAAQNVMWALNAVYHRDETRSFLRRRAASLGMIALALVGFGLCVGLLVLGPHLSVWIGDYVGSPSLVKAVWWAGQWPLLVGALLLVFAGMLYFGPNVDHPRWQFLTLGAGLAVVVWLAASGAFAFYVSRFSSYNKAWGSLSAVVVMLVWLWLSGVALLLGAEVNVEAERSRELRRGEPAEVALQAPPKA